MQFKFQMSSLEQMMIQRGLGPFGRVQKFIDGEVLDRCKPYIPKETGEIIRSGIQNTVIGSGEVRYQTPYARRWYYIPAKFHEAPKRGNYWFERMKNDGGKEQILEGARKMAGAK